MLSDSAGDGTPDFLRLDDESDRFAFRRWFTFLAEWQCFRPPEALPPEINDCAALIRFAYREALRAHDGGWAQEMKLDQAPPIPSVQKYRYPFTPLGADLFRIAPGPLRPGDLDRGAFAQFADAQTLRRHNTHLASRDLRFARPADLLFFEQAEQEMPFHAMIYIGPGQFEPPPGDWVVYHTGPDGDDPGEMRRRSVDELVNYPDPRWRPVAGNANFLGVFRWNILREAD